MNSMIVCKNIFGNVITVLLLDIQASKDIFGGYKRNLLQSAI